MIVAYFVLLAAQIATGASAGDWKLYVLTFANSFLVAAAAGQIQNKSINPPGQPQEASKSNSEYINSKGAAKALQTAGYATDPSYASKLVSIIESNGLAQYDILEETKIEEDEEDMAKKLEFEHDWQWDQLAKALDGLYEKGLFGDYNWAVNASKREITEADALFLNTVMLSRQNGVRV